MDAMYLGLKGRFCQPRPQAWGRSSLDPLALQGPFNNEALCSIPIPISISKQIVEMHFCRFVRLLSSQRLPRQAKGWQTLCAVATASEKIWFYKIILDTHITKYNILVVGNTKKYH
jgi:hypothetical protein